MWLGFPLRIRYCQPLGRKSTLRKKLGWPLGKPMVLLVGGGEGMGPLAKTAQAIDASGLDVGLVIVCGRNQRLKATLEACEWENPTLIYGFTRDMPDFMRASDFIVTKAGPGTIAEALNAQLPIILVFQVTGSGRWECHVCGGGRRRGLGAESTRCGADAHALDLTSRRATKSDRKLSPRGKTRSRAHHCSYYWREAGAGAVGK